MQSKSRTVHAASASVRGTIYGGTIDLDGYVNDDVDRGPPVIILWQTQEFEFGSQIKKL